MKLIKLIVSDKPTNSSFVHEKKEEIEKFVNWVTEKMFYFQN